MAWKSRTCELHPDCFVVTWDSTPRPMTHTKRVDNFVAETRMGRGECMGYESTLLGTLREYARLLDEAEAKLEEQRYADLEHEHLGCHVAKTGIYAKLGPFRT